MKNYTKTVTAAVAMILGSFQAVEAHTSFVVNNSTGYAFANASYFATMNAGHGCEDTAGAHFDTEMLEVEIPAGVTSVRPMDAPWGKASVVKDSAGVITKLVWTKATREAEDSNLYRVNFTAKMPNSPWTTLTFKATQTCHDGSGTEIKTVWEGADIPKLNVLAARQTGWNKYTAPADMNAAAIASFFKDAQIVWFSDSAYSSNTEISKLITKPLTAITAGSVFWVKY